MQKINVEVLNDEKVSKHATVVSPIFFSEEGENLIRVVGVALSLAADALTKQHDAPIVRVNGIRLTDTEVKILKRKKSDLFKYRQEFPILQNSVAALLSAASVELQEEYIRKTDINGHYKGTKSFTEDQFNSQVVAFTRATKLAIKFAKEDAEASTMPEALRRRFEIAQMASKLKRLENKKIQAALLESGK